MTNTRFTVALFLLVSLLSGGNTSASLVLPDAEFSYSAPVNDPKSATDSVERALKPLSFSSRFKRVHARTASFERSSGRDRVSPFHWKAIEYLCQVVCPVFTLPFIRRYRGNPSHPRK